MKYSYFIISMLFCLNTLSHGTNKHEGFKVELVPKKSLQSSYEIINKNYLVRVKPILKRSCFNCHSTEPSYPWYHKLPIVKQLIDSDMKVALSHIDFTKNFPFVSHDTPLNDLKALKIDLEKKSMPPSYYTFMNSKAKLTEQESTLIIKWIDESVKLLGEVEQ